MEAIRKALVNSRFTRWILGLARFKFRLFSWLWTPRHGQDANNQIKSPRPPSNGLHGLNTDVFSDIFALLNGQDRRALATASPQLRSLFMPLLFRRICWQPLSARGFPPPTLWSYIRIFTVQGRSGFSGFQQPTPAVDYTKELQAQITSQLNEALPSMASLDEVRLYNIPFGPWTEFIESVLLTSSVKRLFLASDPCENPSEVSLSTVSRLSHVSYNMHRPLRRNPGPAYMRSYGFYHEADFRYPADLAASEGRLARAWLNPKTLESLSMPGEFVLEALDLTVRWELMKELHLEGVFPLSPKGTSAMLDVLCAMPRLRVARLKLEQCSQDTECREYVTQDALTRFAHNKSLLPDLVHFEAPISANDHILSVLPPTLETLLLIAYPLNATTQFKPLGIPASALLRLLSAAEFPTLRSLELSYSTKADGELLAEEELLQAIPRIFPALQHLMVRRDAQRDGPDGVHFALGWDPTSHFETLVSKLAHLETFSFDADIPGTQEADILPARHGFVNFAPASEYTVQLVTSIAEHRARPSKLHKISSYKCTGGVVSAYPWGPWLIWDILQVGFDPDGNPEYEVRRREPPPPQFDSRSLGIPWRPINMV
ncbi:hypothetical protein MIND_00785800 [Mycena indigotica]|uniref:F-box domain-containing protein n=1 Tax=Mycena indigotica TaxID=2126181 RepID=A0A8H6W1L5_9AGAR|nr:uncharacterized protein MIND_00785800 [Mycena indigotica]KAF7302189.1 hypothetical protein MIND_00785800 [Mycena indigotica]